MMPQLPQTALEIGLALAGLALLAWLAGRVTYRIILGTVQRVTARTKARWDDRIVERNVLNRLSHAVPGAVVYFLIEPALGLEPGAASVGGEPLELAAVIVGRVALSFIAVTAASAISAFLDAVNDIYIEVYDEARNRPIKGYLQVLGMAVWIGTGIVVVSILADRSPVYFLSGLGALTAVLMLVFRDTILSLVASLQIASNDMIRIGDWVEMPQANANGDVIDIALHTVKIQNWDKTISTIPTHRFISESFKNWRGMSESGGRRIKRSLSLDLSSIHFLSDEEIAHLARFELLRDYMQEKRSALEEYRASKGALEGDTIPEPRGLTNIGTFRAYVLAYLRQHPLVHGEMTILVRQLAPTSRGLPIEIYCFSRDTAWAAYEGLQGDIFDHLIAVLPEFGLRAFQEPAGGDFARLV